MQQGNTFTTQHFMPISSDYLPFQPQKTWQCQPEQDFFYALPALANASPDGIAPVTVRGPDLAQGRPVPLALPRPTRAKANGKNPQKLLPVAKGQATSKPIVVACYGNEWLAGLLQRLKWKNKSQVCSRGTHSERLQGLLGQDGASWLLASVMLPSTTSGIPSSLGIWEKTAPSIIPISGTIVFADLTNTLEVCFKLNDQTIAALWDYHDSIHCTVVTAGISNDDEAALAKLKMKENFRRATRDFVFRTGLDCLEETEADGSGELCSVGPEKVKSAILALFQQATSHPISEGASQSEW